MIVIDRGKLASAMEALMVAAMEARDEAGLRIMVTLPLLSTGTETYPHSVTRSWDERRIQAITLAAITSLTGETARPSDDVTIKGFEL